jgi:putative membrane protein
MTVLALVLAVLAGAVHVLIFVMESHLWTRESVWRRFSIGSAQQAADLQWMAYNQGFYNLFLAVGALLGVALVVLEHPQPGWALVLFTSASMVAAAAVLVSTGRRYARAAATQAAFPLLSLLAALVARLG